MVSSLLCLFPLDLINSPLVFPVVFVYIRAVTVAIRDPEWETDPLESGTSLWSFAPTFCLFKMFCWNCVTAVCLFLLFFIVAVTLTSSCPYLMFIIQCESWFLFTISICAAECPILVQRVLHRDWWDTVKKKNQINQTNVGVKGHN